MRRGIFVVLSVFLVSCQTQPASTLDNVPIYPPIKPYELTGGDAAAIEASVRSSLRDPSSAVFGRVMAVIDARGTKTVCGFVNGRNGFGGYTGFTPYIGLLMDNRYGQRVFGVTGIGSGPTDISSVVIVRMCLHDGVPI